MKSIRESNIFSGNRRLSERKSVVGAFSAFDKNIFREHFWYPHEEMGHCVEMYNRNSYAQAALNTMKDFIKGGDLVVKSDDEQTRIQAQAEMDRLQVDMWIDEVIENTLKTGNAYAELDFADDEWKIPYKIYPIADSSRIYINCNEFGKPFIIKRTIIDSFTKQPRIIEMPNEEEFYVQKVDTNSKNIGAKWYDLNYHVGSQFKQFRVYGIPINKRKMIHFKLNIGDTSVYGRSQLASTLDDYDTLKQIERSIAIIAKYKAVPRDIIMYGDKENPATDDELDEFIIYLESLEKDESAIVNKPIKRESLAYSGQDINLDYMIQHISKKMIAGMAPDFLMGVGDQASKANAQIKLLSYIIAVYSKRKLFLKPVEEFILKPFLKRNKLKKAWLEFGELDFETKSEKVNRVGSMWTQNLLTFNESRVMLGLTKLGDVGDVYYLEWQQSMMDTNTGMGFPQMPTSPNEPAMPGIPPGQAPLQRQQPGKPVGPPPKLNGNPPPKMEPNKPLEPNKSLEPVGPSPLPNGEPADRVFNHNAPANKKPAMQGGKLPFEPYQKPTNVPKFLPKKQLGGPFSVQKIKNFFKKTSPPRMVKQKVDKIYNIEMPDEYHLESKKDYSTYILSKELKEHNHKETIAITIDDSQVEEKSLSEKEISYETLIGKFGMMFKEPRLTKIYYKIENEGYLVFFIKDKMLIYCHVNYSDILNQLGDSEEMSDEEIVSFIEQWKNLYLMKAIKEE